MPASDYPLGGQCRFCCSFRPSRPRRQGAAHAATVRRAADEIATFHRQRFRACDRRDSTPRCGRRLLHRRDFDSAYVAFAVAAQENYQNIAAVTNARDNHVWLLTEPATKLQSQATPYRLLTT